MALDFSKLTATVQKVADLAHRHATLSSDAQHEIDTIVASIEAALSQSAQVSAAGAAGIAAVASALNAPAPAPKAAQPVANIAAMAAAAAAKH